MIHNFKKLLLALTITSVAGPSMLSVIGCSEKTTTQIETIEQTGLTPAQLPQSGLSPAGLKPTSLVPGTKTVQPAYSNKDAKFADQQDFPTVAKIQYTGIDQRHYNNTILSNTLKGRYGDTIKGKLPDKKLNDLDNQLLQNLEPKFQYPARASSKEQFKQFQMASEKIVQKDFPTLDQLAPFLKKENSYLNVDDLKFQELIDQYQTPELQAEATNDLLQLYGNLVQLMGPKLVSQLYASIDFAAKPPKPGVVASNIFNPGQNKQTIVFYGNLFASQSTINALYGLGWWSVNSLMEVLAHEISHAISNLLWITPASRQYFDASGLTNPQRLFTYSVSPNDYVPRFFGTRMDPIIANPQERDILAYALTWSNYGRTGSYGRFLSDSGLFNEIFAESFTQWLYTPANLQAANWDFLNAFYDNYATSSVQPVKKNLFDFYKTNT